MLDELTLCRAWSLAWLLDHNNGPTRENAASKCRVEAGTHNTRACDERLGRTNPHLPVGHNALTNAHRQTTRASSVRSGAPCAHGAPETAVRGESKRAAHDAESVEQRSMRRRALLWHTAPTDNRLGIVDRLRKSIQPSPTSNELSRAQSGHASLRRSLGAQLDLPPLKPTLQHGTSPCEVGRLTTLHVLRGLATALTTFALRTSRSPAKAPTCRRPTPYRSRYPVYALCVSTPLSPQHRDARVRKGQLLNHSGNAKVARRVVLHRAKTVPSQCDVQRLAGSSEARMPHKHEGVPRFTTAHNRKLGNHKHVNRATGGRRHSNKLKSLMMQAAHISKLSCGTSTLRIQGGLQSACVEIRRSRPCPKNSK